MSSISYLKGEDEQIPQEQQRPTVVVGLANLLCDFREGNTMLALELKGGTDYCKSYNLYELFSSLPYSRLLLFLLKVRLVTLGEIILYILAA